MPFNLTMPKLSPTMEEGTLVKWHKKVGDEIKAGDLIIEVATDKATVEYNALDDGWVRQILVQEGEDAAVNQVIAVLTADQNEAFEKVEPKTQAQSDKNQKQEDSSAPAIEKEEQDTKVIPAQKEGRSFQQPQFTPEAPLENYTFNYEHETASYLKASPLAKKLAKEKGLNLSNVKGSGPQNRIVSQDLQYAQPNAAAFFSCREVPTTLPGTTEDVPLSQMRKTISQRLQESKSFIPHFYVSQSVNVENLTNIREQLKNLQIKLSINDFIVRASALALKKHPQVNAGFNSVKQSIIHFKTIDIAIAVSLASGLITPIVRHADYKSLAELSNEVRLLATRAREGQLNPSEYKGGSFTISNLGMYGITDFQAILNPPQAAILAVSAVQDTPIVHNGQIIPGKILNLTLSVDHRVIDGVIAAEFLKTLKELIENPAVLLLS